MSFLALLGLGSPKTLGHVLERLVGACADCASVLVTTSTPLGRYLGLNRDLKASSRLSGMLSD